MPAFFSLLEVMPVLLAATFGDVMKVIGIIVLVIIVGVILNAIGVLQWVLALAVGLYYLYIYGMVAIIIIAVIYNLVGLGWTIVVTIALLVIGGVIWRNHNIKEQQKQQDERQATAQMAAWTQELRSGICIACKSRDVKVSTYAGTLTCNQCGMVWKLPE